MATFLSVLGVLGILAVLVISLCVRSPKPPAQPTENAPAPIDWGVGSQLPSDAFRL